MVGRKGCEREAGTLLKLLEGILDASISCAEAAWAVQPRAATQRWPFMAWYRSHHQWDSAPWVAVAAHSQQLPVYRQRAEFDLGCLQIGIAMKLVWNCF